MLMKLLRNIPLDTTLKKETVLFLRFLLIGLVVLPIAIYIVGQKAFGPYVEDGGFFTFLGHLYTDFFTGAPAALLLGLGPYLLWQLVRLTWRIFRSGRTQADTAA